MPTTSSAFIGTDLSVHHPVNVVFNRDKDTEFNTPDGNGSFGDTHLIQGKVACGSCHDVHNTPEVAPFLIGSNAASALCTECHTK